MNFDHNHNINLLSNELKLLLSLIKCSCVDELRPWLEEKIDWELFLQLVRHHRVYPSVYHSLKKLESESVPHNVMQFIYKDYQMNTFQMLNLSREMEGIAKLFNENKIMALFLKGPILANELYGDISLRTSGDLDVIVPIAELEKIDSLLIQSGYVKDDYIHTILNDWKWRHHHVTYFHPTKRIKLEIHWRLNPGPAKEPSFNELWKRRRTSRLASTPIFKGIKANK